MAALLAVLFGLGLHADYAFVSPGTGFGSRWKAWGCVALLSALSFIACLFGGYTAFRIVHSAHSPIAGMLGSGILVAIGCWTVLQRLILRRESPSDWLPMDTFGNAMFVVLAEGLASLSLGLGIGFLRMPIAFVAITEAITFMMWLVTSKRKSMTAVRIQMERVAALLSGFLFILVGLLR